MWICSSWNSSFKTLGLNQRCSLMWTRCAWVYLQDKVCNLNDLYPKTRYYFQTYLRAGFKDWIYWGLWRLQNVGQAVQKDAEDWCRRSRTPWLGWIPEVGRDPWLQIIPSNERRMWLLDMADRCWGSWGWKFKQGKVAISTKNLQRDDFLFVHHHHGKTHATSTTVHPATLEGKTLQG